jgi:hypothetical protein
MATAASRDPRWHLLSHGWKHTRPQMLASGLRSRCSLRASSKRFSPMRLTKPGTFTDAGQALLQRAVNIVEQTPASQ